MVGTTAAVLPTPKHRHDKQQQDVTSPSSGGDYDSPKTPGGMTAQRMQCFKTKRCRFWLESRCTRGDRCTYAHTDVELRIPPDLTKTKICTRWKRGTCDKEAGECAYAHGMDDLREASTTTVTTPSTGRCCTSTNQSTSPTSPTSPDGLNFGVVVPPVVPPPPATKLRDSPPYSSRSCQTISSTASTRYTSRRDSDTSSNDVTTTNHQAAATTTITMKGHHHHHHHHQQTRLPSQLPPASSSSSSTASSYPSSASLLNNQSCGSPPPNNTLVGHPQSPIMVECSAISGALSTSTAGLIGAGRDIMTSCCSSSPPSHEPDVITGTSSRVFAQYYVPNNNAHPSSSTVQHSLLHSTRVEEPLLQRTDRWTLEELLLAVLTVPYYD